MQFSRLFWSILNFVVHLFNNLSGNVFKYLFVSDVSPVIIMLLLMIFPVLLFVRNLKNKAGKALPIISIVINSAILFCVLFFSVTPAIPPYLIYSDLGLVDTYFSVIISFLANGGFLFIIGYLSLIIGSVLSMPKKERKRITKDETTPSSEGAKG